MALLSANRIQLLKYLISGSTAAAVEYISFILMSYSLGYPSYIAQPASFIIGMCISFAMNRSWVFGEKDKAHKRFILYAVVAVCNLVISTSLLVFMENYIPAFIAKVAIMGCIAVWNYILFKKVIFKASKI